MWVVFDFRRYSESCIHRARVAHQRGAKVVLVTDRWFSPIAAFSDVVLSARVEARGPSDTLVPALALIEALCEETAEVLGKQGLDRLADIDKLRQDHPNT